MRKLSKTQAKRQYDNGKSIFLLPNRVRLINTNYCPVKVNKLESKLDFQSLITQFEMTNCNDLVGNNASFYLA